MVQRMRADAAGQLAALRNGPRQQRHAHVRGNASNDPVESSEFQAGRIWPAKLGQDLLKALSVGAPRPKNKDGGARSFGASAQSCKTSPAAGCQQDELL